MVSAFARVLSLQISLVIKPIIGSISLLAIKAIQLGKTLISPIPFSEYYPDYFTAIVLQWKHLLKQDKKKRISFPGKDIHALIYRTGKEINCTSICDLISQSHNICMTAQVYARFPLYQFCSLPFSKTGGLRPSVYPTFEINVWKTPEQLHR